MIQNMYTKNVLYAKNVTNISVTKNDPKKLTNFQTQN